MDRGVTTEMKASCLEEAFLFVLFLILCLLKYFDALRQHLMTYILHERHHTLPSDSNI